MSVRLFILSFFLSASLSSSALAELWQKDNLQIDGRVLVQPMPGKKMTAAYMRIANAGTTDRQLVSVRADFAKKTEIHTVGLQDGVMKMRPLEGGLALPAGAEITLAPGGFHIMLIGLNRALEAGAEASLALRFADGTEAMLPFRIISRAELLKQDKHQHKH